MARHADAFAPMRCEQRAGDVLVVPETWGHATINAAHWVVGWATELHFDRRFDLGLGAVHGPEWWRTARDEVGEAEELRTDGAKPPKRTSKGRGARKRRRHAPKARRALKAEL